MKNHLGLNVIILDSFPYLFLFKFCLKSSINNQINEISTLSYMKLTKMFNNQYEVEKEENQ